MYPAATSTDQTSKSWQGVGELNHGEAAARAINGLADACIGGEQGILLRSGAHGPRAKCARASSYLRRSGRLSWPVPGTDMRAPHMLQTAHAAERVSAH